MQLISCLLWKICGKQFCVGAADKARVAEHTQTFPLQFSQFLSAAFPTSYIQQNQVSKHRHKDSRFTFPQKASHLGISTSTPLTLCCMPWGASCFIQPNLDIPRSQPARHGAVLLMLNFQQGLMKCSFSQGSFYNCRTRNM